MEGFFFRCTVCERRLWGGDVKEMMSVGRRTSWDDAVSVGTRNLYRDRHEDSTGQGGGGEV